MDKKDNNQALTPQVGSVINPGGSSPPANPAPTPTPQPSPAGEPIPVTVNKPASSNPTNLPPPPEPPPEKNVPEPPPQPAPPPAEPTSPPAPQPTQPEAPPGIPAAAMDHPLFRDHSSLQPPTNQAMPPSNIQPKLPRRHKRWIVFAALAVLIIGGSAAAYFGVIASSSPASLWSTALSRTATGYDKIASYIQSYKSSSGYSSNLDLKVTPPQSPDSLFSKSIDVALNSNSGSSGAQGNLSVTFGSSEISADVLAVRPPNDKTTTDYDYYLKFSGLNNLAALLSADQSAGNSLKTFDNQWYVLDHSLVSAAAPTSITSGLNISRSEVNSALNTFSSVLHQYVLSSDSKKNYFQVTKDVGKEQQDGRSVYRYKVSINKQNAINDNKAICDALLKDPLFKRLENSSSGNCYSTSDLQSVGTQSADVWVDTGTKLIHRVRLYHGNSTSNYIDIYQNYTGGDVFPFGLSVKSGPLTGNLLAKVNMKTNVWDISGVLQGGSSSSSYSGNLSLQITPSSKDINVSAPTGAKPITDLLGSLGFPTDFSGTSPSSSSVLESPAARDTQRKTDIRAIQGAIEAYYAQNAQYPTLAQINDPNWVSQNLLGLDGASLKDPKGSSEALCATASATCYGYGLTPTGCDNTGTDCNNYVLSATLEAGGTFTVESNN